MFTKLLVGLDGSPQSRVALEQGIRIGQRFLSTILLAHITRPDQLEEQLSAAPSPPWKADGPLAILPAAREIEEAAHRLLEDAARLVFAAGLTAEAAHRTGNVVEELTALAGRVDVTLVGRAGVRAAGDPLGPDTRELMRKSTTPVLVCAATASPMDRCAVAYDGEPGSDQTLAFAARYAEIAGAQLEIIHVSANESSGRAVLARASGALSVTPLHFETHLEPGTVSEAIPEIIHRLHCNALFTGAIHDSGRWLVASHAEAILRATDIPVLIYNQPQKPSARVSNSYRRSASR